MNTTCIFIGGKQIGANALKTLLSFNIIPELVIANPDDDGTDTWHESLVKIALNQNLALITDQKVRNPEIVKKISDINPEIIFCIGGMQIIPKEVLTIPRLGTLNIHPALLPKYRGRFSTAHAIFNGEKEHGVTLHWMDEGIDTGPILLQKKYPIYSDDTSKEVYDKFTVVGSELFKDFLTAWTTGKELVARPQDESQATYYAKGLPGNGEIDWSWSANQIRDWIRAMTFPPFPPPHILIGERKLYILEKKYFDTLIE